MYVCMCVCGRVWTCVLVRVPQYVLLIFIIKAYHNSDDQKDAIWRNV